MQVTLVPRFLPLFPTARRLLSIAACPIAYRTTPSSIGATPPTPTASVCYIIGGLYGNKHALDEIERMAALETTPPTLIFNGDFNFFNVDSKEFTAFNERILNPQHLHTTGNIEYEISSPSPFTGCGCSYPDDVPIAVSVRADAIVSRLKQTAADSPHQPDLHSLPTHLTITLADATIAIVHGDLTSLNGWSLSAPSMSSPTSAQTSAQMSHAALDIIACTHTCLAHLTHLEDGVVANNGSAGMSNFEDSTYGVITRLAVADEPVCEAVEELVVYETVHKGVRVSGVKVEFDGQRFKEAFRRDWAAGSPGYEGYWDRIENGVPGWRVGDAFMDRRRGN